MGGARRCSLVRPSTASAGTCASRELEVTGRAGVPGRNGSTSAFGEAAGDRGIPAEKMGEGILGRYGAERGRCAATGRVLGRARGAPGRGARSDWKGSSPELCSTINGDVLTEY